MSRSVGKSPVLATQANDPPAVLLPFQTHGRTAATSDCDSMGRLLSVDQPQAVTRALASIPHSRAMAMVSQMTVEEQFKLVQQLVNVRTLAPKVAVEFARNMQAAKDASRAKAG